MRLALTAIARSDSEDHPDLVSLFDSAKTVGFTDLVLGVDDRSHPNTVEWAEDRWGSQIDAFTFEMEADGDPHFANARNLTLARVPKACEWWGWADADDTIEACGGKPTIVAMLEALRPSVGAIVFNYHYADDAFGNPKGHLKARLFRSSVGWEWRDRVHEDVHPTGGRVMGKDILVVADSDESEFVWRHHKELVIPKKGRNFRCLRRMLQDDPDDLKAWFFLGNQHFAAGNWKLAIDAYERYAPQSDWGEQKYWALVYSAIAYRALGDAKKAVEPDTTALHLFPNFVDPYFGLGESYCRMGDWATAIKWGELGFERLASEDRGSPQKAIPSAMIWFNATSYNYQPYLWMATAYMNTGENEKALSCYKQAYKARPEEDLEAIIRNLEWAMNRERVTINGLDLAAGLVKLNEPIKAMNILTSLPAGSKDDERVVRYGATIAGRVAHLRDRTAYQNFYFRMEETSDPFGPDTTDAALERYIPRMMWALRRLQAAGAKRVLDIGIGDGTFAFLLARHGIQVVGIDVDWRRVQQANKNAVRAGYQGSRTMELDPLLELSGECTCPDEHPHAFDKCADPFCECEAKYVETAKAETTELPEASPDSMAQFLYAPPDELTPQVRALGPFDAAVGMELVEHVSDPEAILALLEELAPRVLLSTPDGSWSGPVSANPGHVRAYSQRDLTRLVVPRGWPVEMHVVQRASNEQGQLVAEYTTGVPPQADARVVIFCPPTAIEWSPESLRTGLGGSETAVVHVAREFARMGKRVTVYAMCEGLWDGVRYRRAQDFTPEPCEVFIAWRNPAVLSQMKDRAAKRFIWTHDIHFGEATREDLEGVTAIALSEWHHSYLAQRYPGLDIAILGNGIDPERFAHEVERIPHRLIYAQSPDRGLDRVLDLFPKIKDRWPDASLAVFYGFDAARGWYPEWMADLEKQLASTEGVTVNGWVGQDRLAEEYLKADCLLYPAITPTGELFPETYCISVVEAQAGGCYPITSKHGALFEINAHGVTGTADTFESGAFRALETWWALPNEHRAKTRKHMRAWGRQQTWRSVAERWLALIAPAVEETAD